MPGWLVVVVLVLSNVAFRALVGSVVPEADVRWTTAHLLTWVAWFVVVVPGVLVGWARLEDVLQRRRLRVRLDAWRREGGPLRPLAEALVEADQYALLEELMGALEPRGAEPAVAALIEAARRYLAVCEFGSGAFRADG